MGKASFRYSWRKTEEAAHDRAGRMRAGNKTVSHVGYLKVIPYNKFEHFGIIRFSFLSYAPDISVKKCIYLPCDRDLSPLNPKQYHFQVIRRSFPIPSLKTLGSFLF